MTSNRKYQTCWMFAIQAASDGNLAKANEKKQTMLRLFHFIPPQPFPFSEPGQPADNADHPLVFY